MYTEWLSGRSAISNNRYYNQPVCISAIGEITAKVQLFTVLFLRRTIVDTFLLCLRLSLHPGSHSPSVLLYLYPSQRATTVFFVQIDMESSRIFIRFKMSL